ncbi:MAG: hypothetical protein NPINA01_01050 [Nitrospinaceae bacterium]|nr:MAG: hypothetical protein NPINA01_01050 [Nitrospinaceae bacterium]
MVVSVRTSDLKPGMVVARDVKDLHGRLLVPAGVKASAKHLKVFKIWGVPEVFIEGKTNARIESDPLEVVDPKKKKAIEGKVKALFSRNDLKHPFIQELVSICIHRELKASSK